ncbi:Oidioi.mRNA.OKI2018_I69.chr2.g5859.t1.cds [Oikopleura dioica]|uniref:Oidioi.mRNA.OKI2018_I69.chr2.g5859.t1.cds n=1 Tax=Oikopleura dioica TaxID=34765 RepID=A0ABN7TAP7_OIKDI|nr:Oidioi.mRNA.OKI2018_I69.chr2.g5859.t1.cds [Oikopleura dioica]
MAKTGIFPLLLTPPVVRQAIAQQAQQRKPLQESPANQSQKKAKKRSFRIDDILSEEQNATPLNALLELTHSNSFGSSGNEFSAILGKNHRSKKRRKSRTAFSNFQLQELEKRFEHQKYLTPSDRDNVADTLGLTSTQVITWFQNRRAKLKRDKDESSPSSKSSKNRKALERIIIDEDSPPAKIAKLPQ